MASAKSVGARVHEGGTYVCMEGPAFSTLAESRTYRAWGFDIIGMTNLQEAKLAREAEICYTTIALVTDYDCWHPDHDSVTVDMIIANLVENASTAQQIIAEAVGRDARRARVRLRPGAGARHHHPARARAGGRETGPRAHHRQVPPHIMRIIVTGSIAYDYLMSFPGSFTEHLLPDHLQRVSLSFLVDTMDKRRGGCAPNIAYTLALLGERPVLMGTAGQDFDDYRRWLDGAGIDTSLVTQIGDKFTASFFCSTDKAGNQIASFYTGAMANAGDLSFRDAGGCDLAIISPNDPAAMVRYARECRELGIPYIYDPSQQVARMGGDELKDGVVGARIIICNDYEYEIIREKTGLDAAAMLQHAEAVIITKGEKGSSIHLRDRTIDTPAVPPSATVDPTGVGDAFRGGLMKGLAAGAPWETCGRLGSVAATYALEHMGGSSHRYTWDEFKARYESQFGALAI